MDGEEEDEYESDNGYNATDVCAFSKILGNLLENIKFSDFLVEIHCLI